MGENKKIFRAVRRILCAALVLTLAFLCACDGGKKAQNAQKRVLKNRFTEMPCYALGEDATPEQMRTMAIKAVRDQLTVPWYVSEDMSYRKSGVAGEEVFRIKSSQTYGGMPYTNGSTGLFHWLQHYDFETGELVGVTSLDISHNLGNTCCNGIMWGVSAVCTSASAVTCSELVTRNGFYPVGEYASRIDSVACGTDNICKDSGKQTMFKSYAQMQPADMLDYYVFNKKEDKFYGHIIMAIEPPHIEYKSDGSIDGAKSYITYQDQHVGISSRDNPFYVYENGTFMHYSGHRDSKFSFNGLYANGYIPITIGEFTGKIKHQKAYAKLGGDAPKSYADLYGGKVFSNYNIITITVKAEKDGKTAAEKKFITGTSDVSRGRINQIALKRILSSEDFESKLKSGTEYDFKITTFVGTGETLPVYNGKLTYNK